MKKCTLFLVVSMLLSVLTYAQSNIILVNGSQNPTNICSWNGSPGSGDYLNIQLINSSAPSWRFYYKPASGCPFLNNTSGTGPYSIGGVPGYYVFIPTGNVNCQCVAGGCSTYWGNIDICAVNNITGAVLSCKTIYINPAGGYPVTGPSSFRGTGQFSTTAPAPNWQISDAFNYQINTIGNPMTLAALPHTPLNSPVQLTASSFCINNIITTNRDPLIYVSTSTYPFCAATVDVADHANANYPNAPSWAGLKHFTYNWLYNGSSAGTTQNYFYSAMPSGATLKCQVSQYQWNGSTWVLETQEMSNTMIFNGSASCGGGIHRINSELQMDLLSEVSVSPSPFRDEFTLKMNLLNNSTYSFELYDLGGRVVKEVFKHKKLDSGNHIEVINASSIPSGIYIYKVKTNGQVYTGKIVKE